MWTRKELKEKGKLCFKRNYWKCVLVALIISFIAGGSGGFSGGTSSISNYNRYKMDTASKTETVETIEDENDITEEDKDKSSDSESDVFKLNIDTENPEDISEQIDQNLEKMDPADKTAMMVYFFIVFLVVFLVIFAIVFVFSAFIINPIMVGCNRFFLANQDQNTVLSEMGYAFKNNYVNSALGLLISDILIGIGFCIFIIPGAILSYSYRMVPYILADEPGIGAVDALKKSRAMMQGNKWACFVYDLSYIGWFFLSLLTCGLLSFFYVSPYKYNADAALYKEIKGI